MPKGPGFWLSNQIVWVARWGLPASWKARGMAPTMEPPPLEIDKELAWQLQQEEVVAEESWLGWEVATLEVVMEAAGPLTWGQLESLGGRPRQLG